MIINNFVALIQFKKNSKKKKIAIGKRTRNKKECVKQKMQDPSMSQKSELIFSGSKFILITQGLLITIQLTGKMKERFPRTDKPYTMVHKE